MIENFEKDIENIKNISFSEKKIRKESLKIFNTLGFPNKRLEDWKFTDFNKIINENFEKIESNFLFEKNDKVKLIDSFEHNSIILIDGNLSESNFRFEDKSMFKIINYNHKTLEVNQSKNSLINLNDALYQGGYFLEIFNNYTFNKPLVVYNYFSNNLKNKIINNKNFIKVNDNSKLEIVELNSDNSKHNFIYNNYTSISIGKNSTLKNYSLQGCKSNGFFYKYIKGHLEQKSNYEDYIFSSGLKFNRTEEEINIEGEESSCNIQSALFLDINNHHEIKTTIKHLKPNCKSYQKIKNVLNDNCKGAYQGKIFVKDIAQKTDAYQLSKALLLKDTSEFDAKPELEIYADDVKCSHGSTSGSMNEDSIYYLMTRGLSRKKAVKLLIEAFLFEVVNSILNDDIKKFIKKNLNNQIYGY